MRLPIVVLPRSELPHGEPSLRKDFGEIIHTIAQTPGIQKVATTTNGYRLAKHIGEWREAGLTQLNVSVDSLDPRMFAQIIEVKTAFSK